MNYNIFKSLLLVAILAFFASCSKNNNPPSKVEDVNAGNERIYGDIDGPPRQTANTYPSDPADIAQAAAAKKKLFSEE